MPPLRRTAQGTGAQTAHTPQFQSRRAESKAELRVDRHAAGRIGPATAPRGSESQSAQIAAGRRKSQAGRAQAASAHTGPSESRRAASRSGAAGADGGTQTRAKASKESERQRTKEKTSFSPFGASGKQKSRCPCKNLQKSSAYRRFRIAPRENFIPVSYADSIAQAGGFVKSKTENFYDS